MFFESCNIISVNRTEMHFERQNPIECIRWMYGFIRESSVAPCEFENDAGATRMVLRNEKSINQIEKGNRSHTPKKSVTS